MKKKYYYYVASILKASTVSYARGTIKTKTNDFPLLETENKLSRHHIVPPYNVVITFYKEITEETYKTYNND